MTKVGITADWHGYVPPKVPECDLLIVAGDIGTNENFGSGSGADLESWITQQPMPIVAVAGNHDFDPEHLRELPWMYLEDEVASVAGLKIWGSPWSLNFGYGWAFNKSEEQLAKLYAQIPEDVQVIVSHGPPFGSCDLTLGYRGQAPIHVGSKALMERMRQLPALEITACGHIHPAYGYEGRVVNGSLVNEKYQIANDPIVVKL